jgi:hypothetical protein
LTTLPWGLFWGIVFGMANALLSLLACMVWYSLIPGVQFLGSTGKDLNGYFGPTQFLVSDPRVVVLLLLALWVSVTGGAIVGIFNMQGEGVARISHPGLRK